MAKMTKSGGKMLCSPRKQRAMGMNKSSKGVKKFAEGGVVLSRNSPVAVDRVRDVKDQMESRGGSPLRPGPAAGFFNRPLFANRPENREADRGRIADRIEGIQAMRRRNNEGFANSSASPRAAAARDAARGYAPPRPDTPVQPNGPAVPAGPAAPAAFKKGGIVARKKYAQGGEVGIGNTLMGKRPAAAATPGASGRANAAAKMQANVLRRTDAGKSVPQGLTNAAASMGGQKRPGFKKGGAVKKYAAGGPVKGPGSLKGYAPGAVSVPYGGAAPEGMMPVPYTPQQLNQIKNKKQMPNTVYVPRPGFKKGGAVKKKGC